MTQQMGSDASPSVLTIRLHHTKTSFTATFKTRLSGGSTHKTRCSCSRLNQVWIGSECHDDASPHKFLLPETPHDTTVLRFVFRSAKNTQEANDICTSAQKLSESENFRNRMLEMLTALATVCEAEHLSEHSKTRPTPRSLLLPFRTSNLDRTSVSEEVRAKMLSPLPPSAIQAQGLGYVYILRSQSGLSTMSVLKIGFSKYHPEHRAHELASCLPMTEVVAHTPLLPHARRVESLIHAELLAKRKVLACGQCGQDHKEWFEISFAESREIVIKWSRWILCQPYLEGKLSDEWCNYLGEQDFGSTDPETTISRQWEEILDNFPHTVTDPSPENQLAAYVNACYFENVDHRLLGLKTGQGAKLREAFRDSTDGRPLEIQDFREAEVDFQSLLSKLSVDFDDEIAAYGDQNSFETRHDFEAWKEQIFEKMEGFKNLTTGSKSVSDPDLGNAESPLGDATLLPVVSLKTVGQLDAPARNWFGYTPTHQGFQLLQEAHQKGEWIGNFPQFKLPKGFRKANRSKLSKESDAKMKDTHPSSSTHVTKGQYRPKKDESSQKETAETSGESRGSTVRLVRSEGRDTWEFSTVVDDEFKKQMKEMMEVAKTPVGRALLKKEALRGFRHYGLDFSGGYETHTPSNSSESSSDEMSVDQMDIDEPEEVQPGVNIKATRSTGKEPFSAST